jgi:hypothetical protein
MKIPKPFLALSTVAALVTSVICQTRCTDNVNYVTTALHLLHICFLCHNLLPITWQSSTKRFSAGLVQYCPRRDPMESPFMITHLKRAAVLIHGVLISFFSLLCRVLFVSSQSAWLKRSLLNGREACVCHIKFHYSLSLS